VTPWHLFRVVVGLVVRSGFSNGTLQIVFKGSELVLTSGLVVYLFLVSSHYDLCYSGLINKAWNSYNLSASFQMRARE
jgi:uncharacterized membrane protein